MALRGGTDAANASTLGEVSGPAGPEALDVEAAKKKRGKRGPTGPTGATGPAALLTRASEDFAVPDGSHTTGQVNCPAGEATGGGVGVSNTACSLVSAGPVGTAAWAGTAKCPGGSTATMKVTVICLG